MFKCFPPNSFTCRVWPPVTGGQLQPRLEKWLPPALQQGPKGCAPSFPMAAPPEPLLHLAYTGG